MGAAVKSYISLRRFLPFLHWSHHISKGSLLDDMLAGLTVSLVLVPQAIAYAQLAGLPPEVGLYASLLPPVIAALFGSSRFLATGPVAVISLITASSLASITVLDKKELYVYAILLSFLVGVIQLVLGALKLGLVVNFISHPVIIGFSNAAAIIIATSQLPKLFGVFVETYEHHYQTLYNFFLAAIIEVHWLSVLLAAYAFVVIITMRKISPKIPGVLIAVLITTFFSFAIGFEEKINVSANNIQSQRTTELLTTYQTLQEEIKSINKEKNVLLAQQELLINKKDAAEAVLNTQLALQRINFELDNLKNQHAIYKKRIRTVQLIEINNGKNIFTSVDEAYNKQTANSKVWHMNIQDNSFDTASIPLVSGGSVIGSIPQGLPILSFPDLHMGTMRQLFNGALVIALLGFMESISIAKSLASRSNDKIDPNQELIGQGLANVVGSMTQGYPVAGSFSRTAVNYQAGAKTGMASVFASLFVLLTLLFFTPLLYHLPQSVLAVIIITSVIGLIKFDKMRDAWRTHRSDGVIALITFVSTLFYAPELDKGILIGIVLSTGYFIYSRTHPRIALLSRNANGILQDATLYHLPVCKHIVVLRFDGSLFFANASYLENNIIAAISQHPRQTSHIILVANGINYMDYTGIETLGTIDKNLSDAGKTFILANVKSHILDEIKASGLYADFGKDHIFEREHQAIKSIYDAAHQNTDEKKCPFIGYK